MDDAKEDMLKVDWLTIYFCFLVTLIVATGYIMIYLGYQKAKQRKHSNSDCPFSDEDNPFKAWEMKEQLKCKKCGKVWEVVLKRFDYVLQKITDDRAKHGNCDGEVEVSAIWCKYREETAEEKKWKEYVKRFR